MFPTVLRFSVRFFGGLAAINPRAWLLVGGLGMAWLGAETLKPGAGWLLCGLIVCWDSTRDLSKK
jgi:hypothetical protein